VSDAISSEVNHRFFPFHCDISSQSLPAWLHPSPCVDDSHVSLTEVNKNIATQPPPNWNVKEPSHSVGGVDIVMMVSNQTDNFALKDFIFWFLEVIWSFFNASCS
jgi:hypothetical protein